MDGQRRKMSLAKQLTRSLKLSQRLTMAHTKAVLKTQRIMQGALRLKVKLDAQLIDGRA